MNDSILLISLPLKKQFQRLFLTISDPSQILLVFFLMIRPPPNSTLFPYPTLFRSMASLEPERLHEGIFLVGIFQSPLIKRYPPHELSGRPQIRLEKSRLYVTKEHFFECGDTKVDRKSTRLNSSHSQISYAVFCLKR